MDSMLPPYLFWFFLQIIKKINTGARRRRGRRTGEDLNPFSYCFIKKINTGGKGRRMRRAGQNLGGEGGGQE